VNIVFFAQCSDFLCCFQHGAREACCIILEIGISDLDASKAVVGRSCNLFWKGMRDVLSKRDTGNGQFVVQHDVNQDGCSRHMFEVDEEQQQTYAVVRYSFRLRRLGRAGNETRQTLILRNGQTSADCLAQGPGSRVTVVFGEDTRMHVHLIKQRMPLREQRHAIILTNVDAKHCTSDSTRPLLSLGRKTGIEPLAFCTIML